MTGNLTLVLIDIFERDLFVYYNSTFRTSVPRKGHLGTTLVLKETLLLEITLQVDSSLGKACGARVDPCAGKGDALLEAQWRKDVSVRADSHACYGATQWRRLKPVKGGEGQKI